MKKTTLKLSSGVFYSINVTHTHFLYWGKAPAATYCLFKVQDALLRRLRSAGRCLEHNTPNLYTEKKVI